MPADGPGPPAARPGVGAATPAGVLDRALLADPARPLVTFYDDATGERVELSVVTFANWVAKTANLLRDELGVVDGARVAIHLPVHWQAAVWLAACWAAGAVPTPGAPTGDVAVVAAGADGDPPDGDLVVLGLGPLGLARPGTPVPAGALDYDREIAGHGDRFAGSGQRPEDPALGLPGGDLTAAELLAAAERAAAGWLPEGGRTVGRLLCAEPADTLPGVLATTLVPLLTGAGVVLCRNLDPARLPDRVAAERVVAVVDGGRLPANGPPEPRAVT
jgi:uncharacterized protein (TIGR03089 family)